MFRRFMKRRFAIGGLAAVAALALAGGAFAYFTSTGSGNSSATAGSASNYSVTVNKAGSPTANVPLFPTTTSDSNFSSLYQPYSGVVTNQSTGHQQVSLLTANIVSVTPTGSNVCDVSNFRLYSPNGGWSVASGGQSATAGTGTSATSLHGGGTQSLPYNMAGGAALDYNDLAVYLLDTGANQDGCQGATVNVSVTAS